MKKRGFTLSETLITLGIIGVIAAMTIPNLIAKNEQRKTVTKLQRAISVMNQAYKQSVEDNGEISIEEFNSLGGEEYVKKYWQPYLKATYCANFQACGYKTWGFTLPNGNSAGWYYMSSGRPAFYTMDGFLYIIIFSYSAAATSKIEVGQHIFVDLNGGEKPNKFGHDVFMLTRLTDGEGVQPMGYRMTDEDVNKGCSYKIPDADFITCAEKIRRAGWQIDKSYPWK